MADRYTVTFTKAATGTTKRTIRNVPPLNTGDAVTVGSKTMTISPKNTLKQEMGKNTTINEGDLFLQTSASTTTMKPVEITAISSPGTSGATVTVHETDQSGILAASGSSYSSVIPMPYPHMAAIGMQGIYFSSSVPSNLADQNIDGGKGRRISTGFIMLPLTLIGRYT